MNLIEMAREAGFDIATTTDGTQEIVLSGIYTDVVERFANLVAEATKEKNTPPVVPQGDYALPKLTDEKIGELWHQSGGHVYKFAKLLREWLANACRGT